MVEGGMGLLGLLCCGLPAVAIGIAVQGALFRLAATMVGGVEISWPMAIVTTLCAGFIQSLFTGVFFGADAGACGALCGYLVWAGVCGGLTELTWGQSLLVGLVMVVLTWLFGAVIAVVALGLGLSAAGVAALATL